MLFVRKKFIKSMKRRLRNLFALSIAIIAILIWVSIETNNFYFVTAQENKEKKAEKSFNECKDCCEVCKQNYTLNCPSAPYIFERFRSSITHEDEMGRLDNFLVGMQNDSDLTGYIVVYGGRINKYGEWQERVKRIHNYIKYRRKFDISRIKSVHGGFREKFEFELWLSPIKNSFPPLSPTVSPEQVKFRGKMKPLDSEL